MALLWRQGAVVMLVFNVSHTAVRCFEGHWAGGALVEYFTMLLFNVVLQNRK